MQTIILLFSAKLCHLRDTEGGGPRQDASVFYKTSCEYQEPTPTSVARRQVPTPAFAERRLLEGVNLVHGNDTVLNLRTPVRCLTKKSAIKYIKQRYVLSHLYNADSDCTAKSLPLSEAGRVTWNRVIQKFVHAYNAHVPARTKHTCSVLRPVTFRKMSPNSIKSKNSE